MGEVGTNSTDSPTVETKMNGGLNGNCEDEPMEVDSHDESEGSIVETSSKVDADSTITDKVIAETEDTAKREDKEIVSNSNVDVTIDDDQQLIEENGNHEKPKDIIDTTNNNEQVAGIAKTVPDNVTNEKETLLNKSDTEKSGTVTSPLVNLDTDKNGDNTVRLNNGGNAAQKNDDNGKGIADQIQENAEEVHSISDSDDDEPSIVQNNSLDINNRISNGTRTIDDDKPVSIHSDSDSETDYSALNRESNNDSEVHEILSDKEDCVVIEDDKKIDSNDQLSMGRRANRSRKSAVTVRDFAAFDDDIEEIIEDPLQQPALKKPRLNLGSQITIKNARSLAGDPLVIGNDNLQQQYMQANSKGKEPTLVIIDTNSILARGNTSTTVQALQKQNVSVVPVGLATNPTPTTFPINSRASITPVMQSTPQQNVIQSKPTISSIPTAFPSLINANLLPALSDDMFVLEAPSFIVPYIYEKPPSENLRDVVDKIGNALDAQRQLEENERQKDDGDQKEAKDKDETVPEDGEVKKKSEKKKRKKDKSGDESWDESDTSTDDDASDTEERTKILIKEAKEDLETIKTHMINRTNTVTTIDAEKKDSNNYFDSPLGNFFMDIGVNLVQEYVQTDLLRQQKKKLKSEGAHASASIQQAINSLMKNLELSKGRNDVYKFESKRCESCSFKSDSSLVMAHHYETPHMKGNNYKCNFCAFENRAPYEILLHMKSIHNIQARLEKALSYHQCPNCTFEDNGRSKLARHSVVCQKKFKPEVNLAPPADWEPPAKIPRIKPRHGLVGTANAYQAMAAQAQRAATAAAMQKQVPQNLAANRSRGRPQTITKPSPTGTVLRTNQPMAPQLTTGLVLPNNFQMANAGQFIQNTGPKTTKPPQTPSISITALPRQVNNIIPNTPNRNVASNALPKPAGMSNVKPGQSTQGNKTSFVICEICDGYIKDLDQLRNHMQWMHKVKIHPKMIYNRPPLNCQKCQFRFFTDQGLERHLLGSHGLVTSSMQESANKGKDAGRCPVCGRMYQWKLLNHVSRDHSMTLKPAHLSYKCTVCTATFGMYKQFENHVYSAHSTVAKKAMDKKNTTQTNPKPSGLTAGDSLLKPLKINDEITIIPQPASRNIRSTEIESHVID